MYNKRETTSQNMRGNSLSSEYPWMPGTTTPKETHQPGQKPEARAARLRAQLLKRREEREKDNQRSRRTGNEMVSRARKDIVDRKKPARRSTATTNANPEFYSYDITPELSNRMSSLQRASSQPVQRTQHEPGIGVSHRAEAILKPAPSTNSNQNGAARPTKNGQAQAPAPTPQVVLAPPPQQDTTQQPFSLDDGGMFGMTMGFDNPGMSNSDVLQDFDFDSFLHQDGDNGDAFAFDTAGFNMGDGEIDINYRANNDFVPTSSLNTPAQTSKAPVIESLPNRPLDHVLSSTISRDHTQGEEARNAFLLAAFQQRRQGRFTSGFRFISEM